MSADIDGTKEQIERELGLDPELTLLCSAKKGEGIDDIFEAIVTQLPAPEPPRTENLKALIFDAHYDPFRGTIIACRLFDGSVKAGDRIRLLSNGVTYLVDEVGHFQIQRNPTKSLSAGEVGYIIAGIKNLQHTRIGDTIVLDAGGDDTPLPGFKEAKPVVFSSIYPMSQDDYQALRETMEKYELNDASLTYKKDSSAALGQGFRCGYLGLLHLEIFQQRLEREYNQSIVMTVPSVEYKIKLLNGDVLTIDNPQYYPDPSQIQSTQEPYIRAELLFPERYIGVVMTLVLSRRGTNPRTSYPTQGRIGLVIDMPLAEAIYDFYDTLKTVTQGYGSFDYEITDYRTSDLVRLDILVNGEKIDALSLIVFRDKAREWGVRVCDRLKDEIPRHQFKIAIQGAIGGKIISRSTVTPFRKDVTAGLYGGDVTRKNKLLDKQKKGKKKMKMIGSVNIPSSAFAAVLKAKDR